MLKARDEVEMEKSKYQKLLSEKRLVEEKLEIFEQQSIMNASCDGLKRNESDLSLQSFQQNGYLPNGDTQSVSCGLNMLWFHFGSIRLYIFKI